MNRLGRVLIAFGRLSEAQSLLLEGLEENIRIPSRPSIIESLESFVHLCRQAEDWECMVRFSAVVASEWLSINVRRSPWEASWMQKAMHEAHLALSIEAYTRASQTGRAMSLDDAITEAQAISYLA